MLKLSAYSGLARPGYVGQLGPRSHWQKKLQVLPPHDNLDILGRTGFYFFLVCRAGYAGQVRRNCRLRRQFRNFFPGKNPDLGRAMPGRRGRRARCGAVGRASTKPLGEPVLRGRWASQLGEHVLGRIRVGASHQTRLGRAIKRGWGEPSNEVGRTRTKPLGEPVLVGQTRIGRASWASQY